MRSFPPVSASSEDVPAVAYNMDGIGNKTEQPWRLMLKGDTIEMSANALGLTMESNGIRILKPFDTSVKFSNASGKTNIHVAVSDIFMNFSFNTLRLFLAVKENRSSEKYEFDHVNMARHALKNTALEKKGYLTSLEDEEMSELVLNEYKYDRSILRNPNKVHSLIRGFCASPVNFHVKDGSGYKFLGDLVLQLDKLNPQGWLKLPFYPCLDLSGI
ncbi:unnamed protein product [Lactuca saligna]|uniref:Peptidase M1 alanyl aminopeptidase C-terminal domain-containing protein n=1 Tax=Lactuca saligna TaxID=75948 RepID=A0AA36EC83_LACSI|nr:unnamed protein product [Lactuca saligna]